MTTLLIMRCVNPAKKSLIGLVLIMALRVPMNDDYERLQEALSGKPKETAKEEAQEKIILKIIQKNGKGWLHLKNYLRGLRAIKTSN